MGESSGLIEEVACFRLGYEREKAGRERAEKTLGEMAGHEVSCAEAIFGSALAKAHTLLADIRKMIEDDTTFPGAVLRVEIDRLVGNATPKEAPSASLSEALTGKEGPGALRAAKDAAYTERNQVVAAMAEMARRIGWWAGVAQHQDKPGEAWDADWRTIVFIDLPTGQVSWHFHDSEKRLLSRLPPYPLPWDGHDTPEKYRRVRALLGASEQPRAAPSDPALPAGPKDLERAAAPLAADRCRKAMWDWMGAPAGLCGEPAYGVSEACFGQAGCPKHGGPPAPAVAAPAPQAPSASAVPATEIAEPTSLWECYRLPWRIEHPRYEEHHPPDRYGYTTTVRRGANKAVVDARGWVVMTFKEDELADRLLAEWMVRTASDKPTAGPPAVPALPSGARQQEEQTASRAASAASPPGSVEERAAFYVLWTGAKAIWSLRTGADGGTVPQYSGAEWATLEALGEAINEAAPFVVAPERMREVHRSAESAAYARGLERAALACEERRYLLAASTSTARREENICCTEAIRALSGSVATEPKAPSSPSGALAGAEEMTQKDTDNTQRAATRDTSNPEER